MTNLSTTESNNSNGEVLDKDVAVEESHIASALLGHFREYYNLKKEDNGTLQQR